MCVNHVSAVLHALNGLKQPTLQPQPLDMPAEEADNNEVPSTSLLCKWNVPKGTKDSKLRVSEAPFDKHDYAKPQKRKIPKVEDFDPRPSRFRGLARDNLPKLLSDIDGEQLCISLLLDSKYVQKPQKQQQPCDYRIPDIAELSNTMKCFKKTLEVKPEKAREIERETRGQRLSSAWFIARRHRLTSSLFGDVLSRRPTTAPDNLVLRIIDPQSFTSKATQHGIDNEDIAVQKYISHQKENGHPDLLVSPSGFIINPAYSFLGASPDGCVYDPSDTQHPFGFLEVKCPYALKDCTVEDACRMTGFFCGIHDNGKIILKREHKYYAQVQGQLALGERPWCDFVVYTLKDIHVQRIFFNEEYWNSILPKLVLFYDKCILPEIVSPLHSVGLKVRSL